MIVPPHTALPTCTTSLCAAAYWQEVLDDKFPLLLTKEMERLGGPTEG